ncbi:hypothetical protein ELI44_37005 [Rhizobium ruizarguesonis]|uniref:hypothetical protein n=1 Tax=Rhizobium ruizarguesonis TaxID=2081791 RepID=UPI0010305897|nr:hypothetical protein [Rhizobium ruizarguesonis]TAU38914.1 hypothetical protein ELI42_32905 [Rhizobium ruizarguesonis]TAU45911.1 hypothetical protein ELI44_37005 [Rhizobium ruizarguesonis]
MPAADALNYPYIRVRNVNWLKRTLMIFPHVVRMTPGYERGAPADDPEIWPFTCARANEKYPLLRSANLASAYVHDCQLELRKELKVRIAADPDAFLERFGQSAARAPRRSIIEKPTASERRMGASFQIHPEKLGDLVDTLVSENLAWVPRQRFGDPSDYLEMHPILGEAVMASLAAACAEAEGLQVVTEFPRLHGKLIGTPRDKILSACLDGHKSDGMIKGQHVLEFLVHRSCDVSLLSNEGIYQLHEERQTLANFRAKLEELAEREFKLPIHDQQARDEKIKDLLADLFHQWDKEKSALAATGRRFFGDGVLSEPRKIIEKIGETLLKPEGALAGAQAAAITGATQAPHVAATGGDLTSVIIASGFGFVVGVVVRGVESWLKGRRETKESPLRYLTALERQGVAFTFRTHHIKDQKVCAVPE